MDAMTVVLLCAGLIFFTLSFVRVVRNVYNFRNSFTHYLFNWYKLDPNNFSKDIPPIKKSFFLFIIGLFCVNVSIVIRFMMSGRTWEDILPPAEKIGIYAELAVAFLLFFPILSKLCFIFTHWFWRKCMD